MVIDKQKYDLMLAKKCIETKDVMEKSGLHPDTVSGAARGVNVRPITIGIIAQTIGCEVEDIV